MEKPKDNYYISQLPRGRNIASQKRRKVSSYDTFCLPVRENVIFKSYKLKRGKIISFNNKKIIKNMNIALISRDSGKKDKDEISDELKKQLDELTRRINGHSIKAYVVTKFEGENKEIKTKFIKSNNPISPVAINLALERIKRENEFKPDAFFVWSREVCIESGDVNELADELNKNNNLLVAGYKFKHIGNEKVNGKLEEYYANKNLIAYRVPWNTCAMWNYELFDKYIGKFDEITLGDYPFQNISVIVDGEIKTTEHKGMEDGLAIAQAVSNPKDGSKDIKFKLVKKTLNWYIRDGKTENHLKKLARKEMVMRDFMAMRNYSIEDLERAEMMDNHN